jgi:diadenosine tetraphosphate (Ap4A) HIT family hydrolase
VIARWDWDAHWPAPVWAAAAREPDAARLLALRESLPALDARLRDALEQRFGTEIGRAQITRE